MKYIVDYVESGKPVVGLRTATHAFSIGTGKTYAKYSWGNKDKDYDGRLRPAGAGRDVGQPLGFATARRARAASSSRGRKTTRSCAASRTATSGGRPTCTRCICRCRDSCTPLVLGAGAGGHEAGRQADRGQEERPDDAGGLDQQLQERVGQDEPRLHHDDGGRHRPGTRGHAPDGGQRLLTGRWAWRTRSRPETNVDLVGEYKPHPFAGNGFQKGVKPSDLQGK